MGGRERELTRRGRHGEEQSSERGSSTQEDKDNYFHGNSVSHLLHVSELKIHAVLVHTHSHSTAMDNVHVISYA